MPAAEPAPVPAEIDGFALMDFEGAGDGDGTEDSPYEIKTKEQLIKFRDYINNTDPSHGKDQFFALTGNITLSEPWTTPIGNSSDAAFKGAFDGGGHTIKGLSISRGNYVGLFGYVGENGTVKDLTVEGSVSGSTNVGGIAARCDGTIEGCSNAADITSTGSNVGGITAYIGNNGRVENCRNTGNIHGGSDGGGIAGVNHYGTISDCHNTGTVTDGSVNIGGIAGQNNHGTISDCHNASTVTGSVNQVGGIVGNGVSDTVMRCYNTGTVHSSSNVGGIAGTCAYGTVENCYNTGKVTGSRNVGGVAGSNNSGIVENCYNTGTVQGTGSSSDNVGGIAGWNPGTSTVKNCYYLDTACGAGIGSGSGSAEARTAERFAAGEVAWLLQGEQGAQVWGQSIGTDHFPLLTGAEEKRVYKIAFRSEGEEFAVVYMNGQAILPESGPAKKGFAFAGWSRNEGGPEADFTAETVVDRDMTVYALFREKPSGSGAVTMADYTCGETDVEPQAHSDTNTGAVTFSYAPRDTEDYGPDKPRTAGEYTVKAVFPETGDYKEVTATADFKITHQFNAGWEQRADGRYHLCACGTGLLLEVDALTQVPAGLEHVPAADTVEKINRVLAEQAGTGEDYVVYDVKLESRQADAWVEIPAEEYPDEGVTVTLPYPEGTDSGYTFSVVHMFTAGPNPGGTEKLAASNTAEGIRVTVKSLSPICVGWKTPAAPTATPTPTPTATAAPAPTATAAPTAPDTGDDAQPMVWALTICLGTAALAGLLLRRSRSR